MQDKLLKTDTTDLHLILFSSLPTSSFLSPLRFSEVHEFEKPNDAQALNLMNSCAAGVLEEFRDIVFAYGVSDEYSFVLKKESQLYRRHASEIVSAVVSFFSSMYAMKWNEFFPHKEMKYPPYFDGRAVCYPSCEILLDYLAWRQVDCHINNQYNTCFWMLVKSGKSKSAAQQYLKGNVVHCFVLNATVDSNPLNLDYFPFISGDDNVAYSQGTQAQEKNELLDQLSGTIDYYNKLPLMFRQGSSVYWDKETKMVDNEGGGAGKSRKIVVVKHCNIIETSFWEAHPGILDEKHNDFRL
ncbi:UNVERIFIED_CONTAM: tRNA(His) guanylyltransferase 1 [Sesamum calycinum]|uniref:tRNA(His) guanylyltransferase n=1 Tax=Sesamum calycinum TaxID=2727403 RepID=A0AAW2MQS0_9LAMI